MKINKSTLSFLAFVLLPIFSSSYLSYFLIKYQAQISAFTTGQWWLVTILLTITSALALSPPTFLAIVYGYFLGYYSIPYLLVINMGAIILVYFLYKILNLSNLQQMFMDNPKVVNIIEKIKNEELKIIFFAKLSPILPFALTNLTFAASGAKLRNILLGGFLGMLPRTFLAIYTGTQARQIADIIDNPGQNWVSQFIIFVLVLVSGWGIFYYIKKSISI